MRKIINLLISVTAISCGTILEPVVEGISTGIIQYVQQDSCNKILTAKVIDYRMKNNSFPGQFSDIDSITINENQFKIARELMLLSDSVRLASSIHNFEKTWQCDCPEQIDSISFISYQTDSIDIFTRFIKRQNDGSYSVINENRRLKFNNDTLFGIKYLGMDFKGYDRNGVLIEKKGKAKRKISRSNGSL